LADLAAQRRTRLLLWTLLIIAATVPLTDIGLEPRRRIRWIPVIAGRRNVVDVILNIGLYFPFGYWMFLRGNNRITRILSAAFLLSLCAETTQVFSRTRFPSTTDLLTNTTGAWLGALWASTRAAKVSFDITKQRTRG
jgi:glycopeptide antibiotics resistance protein